MRTLLAISVLGLGGTFTALLADARTPEQPSLPPSFLELDDTAKHNYLSGPIENTTAALIEVDQLVAALDDSKALEVAEHASFVARTCPYNGAILEVIETLHTTLARAENEGLDGLGRAVAQHWSLLSTLGVTESNGLALKDARSVTEHLRTVQGRVERLNEETRESIAKALAQVDGSTGGLWVSKGTLIRYRSLLQEHETPNAAVCGSEVGDLVQMLDQLIALYC